MGMFEWISILNNIVYGLKCIGLYWDFNCGGELSVDCNFFYNVFKYCVKVMLEYGVVVYEGD